MRLEPRTDCSFTVTVPAGTPPGVYRHNFYVTAAQSHGGAGRTRIAKVSLAIMVQEAT